MIRTLLVSLIAIGCAYAESSYMTFMCSGQDCHYTEQNANVTRTTDSIKVEYTYVGPSAILDFFPQYDKIDLTYYVNDIPVVVASNDDREHPAYIFIRNSIVYMFNVQQVYVPDLPGTALPPSQGTYLLLTKCNSAGGSFDQIINCK